MSYTKQIRNQLLKGTEWANKDDQEYTDGLERFIDENPESREYVVSACKELFQDSDVVVRSGIMVILNIIAKDIGAEWLYRQYKKHPERFVDQWPEDYILRHKTMDKELIKNIARAVEPHQSEIISFLKDTVFKDKEWGEWLLLDLARVDGDWLLDHAKELVPQDMFSILFRLNPSQRKKYIHLMAPWSEEVVRSMSSFFWNRFEEEEARELKDLIASNTLSNE